MKNGRKAFLLWPRVSRRNRPVPTAHWISADNSLTYLINMNMILRKLKQLLDEAGYKDVDGDGFREDPKGKKFVCKLSLMPTDNPPFEARAKALTQYWKM